MTSTRLRGLDQSHDQSYKFNEIKDAISALNIKYFFVENSPAAYFSKQPGKNINDWCDIIDGIKCFPIGMPNRENEAICVIVEIQGNKLLITPVKVSIGNTKNVSPAKERNSHTVFKW